MTFLLKRFGRSVTVSMLSAGLLCSTLNLPGLANGNTGSLRQGLPGRRISGGVRIGPSADSCFADFDQSLVSIMPRSNLGTTASARPTFWFSIPETTGAKTVEFQLLDASEALIYSTQIAVSDEAGLREFQLPESAPELSFNQNYRWVFSLACNNGSQSPVLGLEGWVRRVQLSTEMARRLANASPGARAALYRSAGIWQEQVNEVLNLRRQNPDDHATQRVWAELIGSTGLTAEISNNLSTQMTALDTTLSYNYDN